MQMGIENRKELFFGLKKTKNFLQDNSIPLLLGIIVAICWINSSQSSYEFIFGSGHQQERFLIFDRKIFGYDATLLFLINDGFMVFFFGMAAKGITEAILPGGSLNPVKKALSPLLATLGGILGPILVFLTVINVQLSSNVYKKFSNDALLNGWGVPTATDISLAWVIAKAVFGERHPAINFLLLLAIADDAIGLAIIAIFYPDPSRPVRPVWVLLVIGGMLIALAMRKLFKISIWGLYVAVPGLVSWIGLMKSGIHPALALVPIVPFIPASRLLAEESNLCSKCPIKAFRGLQSSSNPLQQFEDNLKGFVDFGMFFFGLANAGVRFSQIGHMTICIALALIVGKPLGISATTFSISFFFGLKSGLTCKDVGMVSMIGGLGLTVALFVAGVAFESTELQEQAKSGALIAAVFVSVVCISIGKTFGYGTEQFLQSNEEDNSRNKEQNT